MTDKGGENGKGMKGVDPAYVGEDEIDSYDPLALTEGVPDSIVKEWLTTDYFQKLYEYEEGKRRDDETRFPGLAEEPMRMISRRGPSLEWLQEGGYNNPNGAAGVHWPHGQMREQFGRLKTSVIHCDHCLAFWSSAGSEDQLKLDALELGWVFDRDEGISCPTCVRDGGRH